jgi:peptide/nickel transport system permease protein
MSHERPYMSNNWGVVRFIVRRLLLGLLTLFIVSLIVFAATQLLPSDPATAILGRNATPASVADLREKLGLDRSATSQYTSWLKGIVTGDPGESFNARIPIVDYIGSRVINSLFLLVLASVISIPLSLALGAYQAGRRDKSFDNISSFSMLGLAAMPEFVVGLLLVILFSTVVWQVLPAVTQIGSDRPWEHLDQMILPTLTLVLGSVPYISRVTRAALIEVMESDYVEMARLKGAPERTVMWRHAMPNSLGPVFQVIALNIAYFAGGVIVVEYLFNYPGIGGALQSAVRVRDIPVIQFLVMVLATVYVLTNVIADVATILVTPRLRTRVS